MTQWKTMETVLKVLLKALQLGQVTEVLHLLTPRILKVSSFITKKRTLRANESEVEAGIRRQLDADYQFRRRQSVPNNNAPFREENIDETTVEEHYCGRMDVVCQLCGSKNFPGETTGKNATSFTPCCQKGKIKLDPITVSLYIQNLMEGQHRQSKNFIEHIRSFNSSVAFASIGAKIESPPGFGPYCFRIHGQIYHRAGTLHPHDDEPRMYAQLYILDSGLAAEQRLAMKDGRGADVNKGCSKDLMKELSEYMVNNNPFAKASKMLYEVELEAEEAARRDNLPKSILTMAIIQSTATDPRRYNAPRANEVAIVFQSNDGEPPLERDLLIHLRPDPLNLSSTRTKRIRILDPLLDAMTYPLLLEMSCNLNVEQAAAFESICEATVDPTPEAKCFFIDGPGGSGKTYLYKALISTLRGEGRIVLPVASTGIAANLLPGGRTYHSQYKLPVPLLDNSVSSVKPASADAKLIKEANLLIWDESTMAPSYALSAVDRLMKEIMQNDVPFGGKVLLLGGDFRQTLPVVVRGSRSAIVESCIKFNSHWDKFKKLPLVQNVRSVDPVYSEWLLKLGNGDRLNSSENLPEDMVEIPNELIATRPIVEEIFGTQLKTFEDVMRVSDRAILCPKNEDAHLINQQVLNIVYGEEISYLSSDSIEDEAGQDAVFYPTEFLNGLHPAGMPPHNLRLKVGAIVMLLRNLNTKRGLCNGTRLIITK